MVERLGQNLFAKAIPIRIRVQHVQMPHFIDLLRGRHRMPRLRRQEEKPPVLPKCALGIGARPVVFSRQSTRKGKSDRSAIDVERNDAIEERLLLRRHIDPSKQAYGQLPGGVDRS